MSFTKNGFHRTLVDRLDSKRERKSGLLCVMNGCFIINNFGQASCNIKFFKAQPIILKKVTGQLNSHPQIGFKDQPLSYRQVFVS